MRHRIDGYKLGRLTQHRWALFRNLLVGLFRHERIETTEAKAKAVRGLADHVITLAKRENLHARRQVLSLVPDREVVGRITASLASPMIDLMSVDDSVGAVLLAGPFDQAAHFLCAVAPSPRCKDADPLVVRLAQHDPCRVTQILSAKGL